MDSALSASQRSSTPAEASSARLRSVTNSAGARCQNLELFRYRGAWCPGVWYRSWHDILRLFGAEHLSDDTRIPLLLKPLMKGFDRGRRFLLFCRARL